MPSTRADSVNVRVRVQPRASREAILGWREEPVGVSRGATALPGRPERRGAWGARGQAPHVGEITLRLAVTAPPVEGEANEAVRRLLARALRVTPSAVTVVGGQRSRDKVIRIDGLRGVELRSRLTEETR